MDYEIFKLYKEKLNLKAVDVQTTSPLILAYIGDCLYDLAVREDVVSNFPGVVNAVNQKSATHSKNSSIQEYRRATGFEALIGYLYLTEQYERMIDLEARGITHLQALEDRYGEIRHEQAAEAEKE